MLKHSLATEKLHSPENGGDNIGSLLEVEEYGSKIKVDKKSVKKWKK